MSEPSEIWPEALHEQSVFQKFKCLVIHWVSGSQMGSTRTTQGTQSSPGGINEDCGNLLCAVKNK